MGRRQHDPYRSRMLDGHGSNKIRPRTKARQRPAGAAPSREFERSFLFRQCHSKRSERTCETLSGRFHESLFARPAEEEKSVRAAWGSGCDLLILGLGKVVPRNVQVVGDASLPL